ncbi:MAG: hypothetical protein HY059_16745 [Proteobacteria bacterium]|nr:hypothetical protein [Pseudomonadota bacterium]
MSETHLPATVPVPIRLDGGSRTLLATSFATLATDANGILRMLGRDAAVVVESFALWREPAPAAVEPAVTIRDGGVLQLVWDGAGECATLVFAPAAGFDAFDVSLEIEFRTPRRVERDALVLNVKPELSLAGKLNGFASAVPPVRETWLGRGTAVYGNGRSGLAVVHPTGLSSLQVDPPGRRLWLNFDWAGDHPHIVFSREANWDDASAIEWPAGARRRGTVRLNVGEGFAPVARPMLAPGGALAVFAWTEHACNCELRVHRAVYFGHEDIVRAEDAVGGFVKHRIPATKSVFYDNDAAELIFVRGAVVQGEMVAIRPNPAFESFLLELRDAGDYEIIPHGIQPQTTGREKTREALDYMRRTFGSRSWIDHSAIRRDFVSGGHDGYLAFGLDPASEYHRADLWREFGYRYFWNHATEYKEVVPRFPLPQLQTAPDFLSRFKHALMQLLPLSLLRAVRRARTGAPADPGPDTAFDQLSAHPARPVPIWWRHAAATGEFVNWSTRATPAAYFRPGDGPTMRRRLDGLVACWGIDLHHSYPTRIELNNATWREDADGRFVVSEEFDASLAHMAQLRDAGDLHVGTVRDLMAHWEAMESLRVEPQPGGVTLLRNEGSVTLKDLAVAMRARSCRIDGAAYKSRRAGEDWVLWFDLPAGGHVKVISENV